MAGPHNWKAVSRKKVRMSMLSSPRASVHSLREGKQETVEGKFAGMEHRMKSKKESSGSKNLDPFLDPLDNLRPAAGTGNTCNSNRRTEEEHHGRLPGKVKGNEYSSSAANPAGITHGTIEDDSDVASEVESGQLHYKSMW
ncbi:unnamed protein product [Sphagnum troendelagicum]|uniref:Uncharacterized protein n=1 Tax=Sphagnum troendelagicum TaxID=128251 RepID=A0ABP0THE3_9BRYO